MNPVKQRTACRIASAVIVVAVMLLAIPAGVQAATYTSTAHHYHFTAPGAGWNETTASGSADVEYDGPVSGFTTANLMFGASTCSTAVNTDAFLLAVATGAHDQFKAILGGTTQGAPRTFASALGRHASDWSVNYTLLGIQQRVRQVIFVSDGYDLVYTATFTDNTSAFASHVSALDGVVDTFAVDSEPAAPTGSSGSYGGTFSGMNLYIIIGVVVAVVVVGAVMMKRKGKGKQPATQPPAPGAPAAPPAPPRK